MARATATTTTATAAATTRAGNRLRKLGAIRLAATATATSPATGASGKPWQAQVPTCTIDAGTSSIHLESVWSPLFVGVVPDRVPGDPRNFGFLGFRSPPPPASGRPGRNANGESNGSCMLLGNSKSFESARQKVVLDSRRLVIAPRVTWVEVATKYQANFKNASTYPHDLDV